MKLSLSLLPEKNFATRPMKRKVYGVATSAWTTGDVSLCSIYNTMPWRSNIDLSISYVHKQVLSLSLSIFLLV
jgi:hypothetical protein